MREWFSENSSDILKSLVEVLVTVSFTFIPFCLLSIRWLQAEGANTTASFWTSFLKFWQAGEIGLPILALSGGVTALLALNAGYFSWWIRSLVGVLIIILALGVGAALFVSEGFNAELNVGLIDVGFISYGVLAFVWFLLLAKVRTTEPEPRESDRSAQSILKIANDRRKKSRSEQ
ncbi:hypothetical protein [Sulfitobacter pontiacus]|uniref:hypothetical protein n=1 Tax=Sulfitobacter pontiacus TaxID=60137 RepID=UPI00326743AA